MSYAEIEGASPDFDLSDRMMKALRHADISVEQMAEWQGKHRTTIWGWVHGRTRPSDGALRLWAMRTGVSFRWLVDGTDPKTWGEQDLPDNPGYPDCKTTATLCPV